MEIKELSLIRLYLLICCIFAVGCNLSSSKNTTNRLEIVDVSQIPKDTIFQKNSKLSLQNGIYYLGSKPYSGFIKNVYQTDSLKSIGSYFQGKQHGTTKTFFPNGALETERNYKNGLAYGNHFGYWKNGNKKFDFMYVNDKREGMHKKWYETGRQYCELSYTNDQENGMQKAWRENGKIYINYEVKDGIRYGLQNSALCYTLKDEKLK